jgi:hypothetical protein
VPHRVPHQCFVGPEDLLVAHAGAAEEVRRVVVAGEDGGGDALAVAVPGAQQQQAPGRLEVLDEMADAVDVVRRRQALAGEHAHELLVVLGGEVGAVRLLDDDADLLRLPDRSAAGARVGAEDVVVRAEVGDEGPSRRPLEPRRLQVPAEASIAELDVQAAQVGEGEPAQGVGGLGEVDLLGEREAHGRCGPPRERAAQDAHAEAAGEHPGEVPDDRVVAEHGCHDRFGRLARRQEVDPGTGLEELPAREVVQHLPVAVGRVDPRQADAGPGEGVAAGPRGVAVMATARVDELHRDWFPAPRVRRTDRSVNSSPIDGCWETRT